jgi:type VI secretion system protein ImpL
LVAAEEGQNSALDNIIFEMQGVYDELNQAAFSGVPPTPAPGQISALAAFQQTASRLEGPLERWATQLTTSSSGNTADGTRASLNAKWQSEIVPFCKQAVAGKYPFDRRGRSEVKIADFARLFAPGGMIDGFFNENLANHVDTTSRPWTWKQVNGADLGMSDAVLAQLENAGVIRDTFFLAGPTPAVTFDITPEALDPKAQAVTLEVDGQQVGFAHRGGQPRPVKMTWPGQVGFARVTFEPADNGAENALTRDGDWGWFRLLDAAQVRKTNASDRSRVIFNVGGRIAIFQLRAGSVLNPFSLPALQGFQCPESL